MLCMSDFFELADTDEMASLRESIDIEFKKAQGRDRCGELPHSFWESYCAMANSNGGRIYLGVEESSVGQFRVVGIKNTEKVLKALWDGLHDRKRISENLLTASDVTVHRHNERNLIRVNIPRAPRQARPVHLGESPFGNTFVRRHESDYRIDDESVRRMLAERVEDVRDAKILDGFTFDDFAPESVSAYRNRFSAVRPGHVWIDLSLEEFIERIGAAGRERHTGRYGVTLAGLLMFGRYESIREVAPNYMVDFQERTEARADRQWVDRLVPDGTWPGNLYEFFRRVYAKLVSGLKIPFKIESGQRIEDTPIHEALREALVNTLIHGDFTGRSSFLVVKRPDMFGFRNPGLMRVPVEQAVKGGLSDCRNRRLQTMFRLVGYGDHAGSGVPKIYRYWAMEHWRAPALYELQQPEQTLLELRMESLFPGEAVDRLTRTFGNRFKDLPELQRLALVTAASETTVNHARLRGISMYHPRDITLALSALSRDGFLESEGSGRGTVYYLPGTAILRPDDVFDRLLLDSESDALAPDNISEGLPGRSEGLDARSEGLPGRSEGLVARSEGLNKKLKTISEEKLGVTVLPRKVSREVMCMLVRELCSGQFVSLRQLASTLNRSPDFLRQAYLNPMVKSGQLELRFPTLPNHQEQAYRSAESE